MGNANATDDSRRYRDGYPGKEDNPNIKTNLEFYSNKRVSKPEGDTIEGIHKKWFGNYHLLEAHHGYIQWIFPIREDGLNHHAEQLQLHEAKAIANDPVLQGRIIRSYELMLDFYGMKLTNKTTGEIERNDNYKERYAHLNRSFHNYLRITRILKCLGEVGLEHFKIHFVMHVLNEMYVNKQLLNCKESCVRYWAPVLRREEDRTKCEQLIAEHTPKPTTSSNNNQNKRFSDIDEDSDDSDDGSEDEDDKDTDVNKNTVDKNDKPAANSASSKQEEIKESTESTKPTEEKKEEEKETTSTSTESAETKPTEEKDKQEL